MITASAMLIWFTGRNLAARLAIGLLTSTT
jgi:hypothetical protein